MLLSIVNELLLDKIPLNAMQSILELNFNILYKHSSDYFYCKSPIDWKPTDPPIQQPLRSETNPDCG